MRHARRTLGSLLSVAGLVLVVRVAGGLAQGAQSTQQPNAAGFVAHPEHIQAGVAQTTGRWASLRNPYEGWHASPSHGRAIQGG